MTSDQVLAAIQQDYGTSRFNSVWQAQDWCYWDMVGIPTAGASELNFFQSAAGAPDTAVSATFIKTTEQTNLDTSGQIGGAECFVALSLHFDLVLAPKYRQVVAAVAAQTTFAADQLLYARWLQNVSNQGVLQWEINRNTWLTVAQPFRRFPPGFGLGQVSPPVIGGVTAPINGGANAYAALSPYAIYGMGDIFTLDQPVFLAPNTPFTISIEFPQANITATTNLFNGAGTSHDQTGTVFAYAEMRGIKVRPPQ